MHTLIKQSTCRGWSCEVCWMRQLAVKRDRCWFYVSSEHRRRFRRPLHSRTIRSYPYRLILRPHSKKQPEKLTIVSSKHFCFIIRTHVARLLQPLFGILLLLGVRQSFDQSINQSNISLLVKIVSSVNTYFQKIINDLR